MKLWPWLFAAALTAAGCASPPNIIVILTDDQRVDSLAVMPSVQALAAQGFTAANAFTTTPTCGPSRASILTGQYASTHGVETNLDGASAFDASATLATWLRAKGYRTGYFGKYLNGYVALAPAVPPGWDDFVAFAPPDGLLGYYNYTMADNGVTVAYGAAPADYSTDVVAAHALNFAAESDSPFFMIVAPYTPHSVGAFPPTPAPRHAGLFDTVPCLDPALQFESDMSDKPAWLQEIATLWAPEREAIAAATCERRRRSFEALQAVDEFVAQLIADLAARGQLANTMIVYTTDNGLAEHEHWWHQKGVHYDEATRIPLIVRYDQWGGTRPVTLQRLVLNIDIAPTLLAVAGAPIPTDIDGVSLGVLFSTPSAWRTDFLLEYWHHNVFPFADIPTVFGVRSTALKYLVALDGFEELYDLATDPQEWNNLAVTAPSDPRLQQMRDRLAELLVE